MVTEFCRKDKKEFSMITIKDTLNEAQFDKVWDMLGEYPNIIYQNYKYVVDIIYYDGEFRITHYAKHIASPLNRATTIDGENRYLTPAEFIEEVDILLGTRKPI